MRVLKKLSYIDLDVYKLNILEIFDNNNLLIPFNIIIKNGRETLRIPMERYINKGRLIKIKIKYRTTTDDCISCYWHTSNYTSSK